MNNHGVNGKEKNQSQSIDNFFDRVLVMAEDKKLKQNRLALLQAISKLLLQVADYSQIVIEGK